MSKITYYKAYWKNGQIRRETPYLNRQRHGLENWWRSNGQLEYEIPYVNGKRHGISKFFSSNGLLKINIFNNNSHLMSVVLISNLLHPIQKIKFK